MTVHFSPEGHVQWLDSEEFSTEFLKLLGAAQEGGSMVSECFLVASRIDPHDRANSWHREWLRIADCNAARAAAALDCGHRLTAQRNWLRAINYYQASTFVLESADARQQAAIEAMRSCARRFVEHLTPEGEVVEIPWLQDHPLEGYFLPAPTASGRAPVAVCMGDPGHRKNTCSRRPVMPASGEWRCSRSIFWAPAATPISTASSAAATWSRPSAM
jgi:hypothetical protein